MRWRPVGFALLGVFIATHAAADPAKPPEAALDVADIPPIARYAKGFDLALLAPVDGVTPRRYEHATAALTYETGDEAAILAKQRLDKAHYDNAAKVFTQRMIADKTSLLNMILSAYYSEAAEGPYAALDRDVAQSILEQKPLKEKPPMSEARWNELQVYYARKASPAAATPGGLDAMLKPYGMNSNDFQIISNWFGRRDTMPKAARSAPRKRSDAAPTPAPSDDIPTPEQNHPEWGGLWHFEWANLHEDATHIGVVKSSREVCMKLDMKADTLPLMPRPRDAKCALVNTGFYDSHILITTSCDYGEYGVEWDILLEPMIRGESYVGHISYQKMTEKTGNLRWPNPDTRVVAWRVGAC